MSYQEVALGDLILNAQSGFASGAKADDGIAQIRMNNITLDGMLDMSSIRRVPQDAVSNIDRYLLNDGDILFNATNSPNLVGKTARFVDQGEPFAFSNHFVRLVVKPDRLDSSYLARWLTLQQQRGVFELLCTRWVNQASVRKEDLLSQNIPIPPLAEQKRIAAILDQADALRAKRRAALAKLDALVQSVFLEMFGDPVTNPMGWEERPLAEVADIASGVTKGRKFGDKKTVTVPYMRVANVQDGAIDTSDIKDIEVLPEDVEKYQLKKGDILLTEGGDPDKLGRGAVWRGEIAPCIHQNHIFRVRLTSQMLVPEYLSALIASARGKRYFLRAAKQTTGIASINKTQLTAFPALVPENNLQQKYLQTIKEIDGLRQQTRKQMSYFENFFLSLQQRAFRGEL